MGTRDFTIDFLRHPKTENPSNRAPLGFPLLAANLRMNIRAIEDDSLMKLGMVFITILGGWKSKHRGWVFPPKMDGVYFMGKPYFLMDVLGGKRYHYFRKQPNMSYLLCCSTWVMLESLSCDVCSGYWFQNEESSPTYLHYLKLTLRPWKMEVATRSYSFWVLAYFIFRERAYLLSQ